MSRITTQAPRRAMADAPGTDAFGSARDNSYFACEIWHLLERELGERRRKIMGVGDDLAEVFGNGVLDCLHGG